MSYRRISILTVFCAVGLLAGCASTQAPVAEGQRHAPAVYRVAPGDTLGAIAGRYDLDYRAIVAWNQLQTPDLIYPGQQLWLKPPPARKPQKAVEDPLGAAGAPPPPAGSAGPVKLVVRPLSAPPVVRTREPPVPATRVSAVAVESTKPVKEQPAGSQRGWLWPTEGQVVRGYNPAVPGRKGIQIGGRLGQPVLAAWPGQVVYSGSGLPGYGRLIILKHSDSLLSAYGYLGKIRVKEGDTVKSGQTIAELGAGNENRPVLHFEIRRHGKPVNPLDFLSG